ncbi:MAG TPA: phosphoglycerate kinase, partial [Actinomycetota bacterium]|nr:phosphoglycerate kinase [Actinomycetota bacterium]
MKLRTLEAVGDVAGRRVFVRVDYNVPLEGGKVADDSRIVASLPTLRELVGGGASLVLASHLGRPKGQVTEEARLGPVAERLGELFERDVGYVPTDGVVDDEVGGRCENLRPGEVFLLENLRFDPGEEANDR